MNRNQAPRRGLVSREQVEQAARDLEANVKRQVERRRGLLEAAVTAAAPMALGIVSELEAGARPWWPELAPLTTAERAAVYRAMAAGTAAAGSTDVD